MNATAGSVPAVTLPGAATVELAGDRVGLVGARVATRIVWRNADPFGVRISDDAGIEGAIGGRGGTAQHGGTAGALALAGRAHYAIGPSFRARGIGGIGVGLRASAGLLRLGTTTAHYVTVPAFARVELELAGGVLAVEASGVAVLGNRSWAGAVHASRDARFVRLRIERQYVDASVRTPAGRRDLDSLDYTAITLDVGVAI